MSGLRSIVGRGVRQARSTTEPQHNLYNVINVVSACLWNKVDYPVFTPVSTGWGSLKNIP
jgi:hypothetical protein